MPPEMPTLRPAGPAPGSAQDSSHPRPALAEHVVTALVLAGMVTTAIVRRSPAAFPGPTLLILILLAWAPLLVRTRWPEVALSCVVVAECLHLAVVPSVGSHPTAAVAMGAYQPVPIATMVAAWNLASRRPWRVGWVRGGGAAAVLLVVSLLRQPFDLIATDMVMVDLVVLATGAGVLLAGGRERAAREARDRLETTRREVVAERLGIARDLHDVLAHHLTLVNAQAGVAEYLMRTDALAASAALHDIGLNTRNALDQLRATVGLLRQEGDPPATSDDAEALHPVPGLDRLDDLLAGFGSAVSRISLRVTGPPRALAPSGDLAAYRIVQEALTNATKHAPGAPVDVTLNWLRRRLELRITNGPAPGLPRGHRGPGTGHGLIGMRERALTCGGSLTAQAVPDAGFVVHATIPAPEDVDSAPGPASLGEAATS
jgi:signal transduction histidine kinase